MSFWRISLCFVFIITELSGQTYSNLHVQVTEQSYLLRGDNYGSKMKAIVGKGELIQVLEKVKEDMYKVNYRGKVGYMLDLYFPKDVFKGANSDISENNSNELVSKLPPIIHITDISFSSNSLHADTTEELKVKVKNSGPGVADKVYVHLSSKTSGLVFDEKTFFPEIEAKGGEEEVIIPIIGEHGLNNGEASINIEIIEPTFEVNHAGRQLKFTTIEALKPNLILAKHTLIEHMSSNPNRQVDVNETIDLKFVVQNIGSGEAQFVNIDVSNTQKGVIGLGYLNGSELVQGKPLIDVIGPGEYETVTFRYFVNQSIDSDVLVFNISAHERHGKYGFIEPQSYSVNSEIVSSGYIRTVEKKEIEVSDVTIMDVPDIQVDVDHNIPITNKIQERTYVLAIGNEDYSSYQVGLSSEQNVDFAINDVEVFSLYCERTFGIPKKQIKIMKNATSAQMRQGIAWLKNLSSIENGNAKLIFYYSGHGLPDEESKEPYLIPVDVSGNNVQYGISLNELFSGLSEIPSNQITVFLDACFSGGGRDMGLVAMKGVKVRPKKNTISGRMVVFSSSSGMESSAVFREKNHGFFTYYLLKKIQETRGEVDFNDLNNYISKMVRKETGIMGKMQNPELNYSLEVESEWHDWKLN